MSRTKKLVIIFSCIFAVAAIGVGITLGIFYGSGNSYSAEATLISARKKIWT